MQKHGSPRDRIPAAIAVATAATIAQAARLLDRASGAVPLRRAKREADRAEPTQDRAPGRDDTH